MTQKRAMKFYHRTSRKNAAAILKKGFRDATGEYGARDRKFSGVWLSAVPLDENEGACGDVLLEVKVSLPESRFERYEWGEEGKSYREWLIPSALINPHMSIREVSEPVGVQMRKTPERFRKGRKGT